jgi:hypothetical protein
MNFKIADTKPMNKNTLRGIFSLIVGPMKIEGWTYHIKGENSWVSPPSKEYLDKETGGKKYWPIIRIEDDDRYWKFQQWAKDQVAEIFDQLQNDTQLSYPEDDQIPF